MLIKVEITKQSDGSFLKRTQTNENFEFQFLGDKYSIASLRGACVEKVYEESNHEEIKLVRDKYNRLFIYAYREHMRFDSDPDREDNKWSLVSSPQDADLLVKNHSPIWGRIPSVYLSETGYVHVEEYTDHA